MEYAYIRVSSRDQNEDRQLAAIEHLHIEDKNIFVDKKSGKDFNRPQYQKMYKKLREGDTLYLLSLDRLGRDYDEMLEQWKKITKTKKADIVILDNPLLDTRKDKDLMGTFMSDLVLQVLSFCAENERANIRERQREGIVTAKAKGVNFGRPSDPLPEGFERVCDEWIKGELTITQGAKILNMKRSTFYKKAVKYKTAHC